MIRRTFFLFVLVFGAQHFSTAQPVNTHVIIMKGTKFKPKVIDITPYDTVVWINKSNFSHELVDGNGLFKSPVIRKGEKFQHVFTKAGYWQYYCRRHKKFGSKGEVRVIVD